MSEETQQHQKDHIENTMEVIEVTQATELVQGMESRGDFKFRGIYRVFNSILEWTNRFSQNGILPTADQVARENDLDLDRVKIFIQELLGRAGNKTRLIIPVPSLEYRGGANAGISKMIVFCRPTKADGISGKRYYLAYLEKNQKSILNWMNARVIKNDPDYIRNIHDSIAAGKLPDTHSGAEIARLFYNELDVTPEQKKTTYQVFVRPILQKLIQNKKLLYIALKSSAHPYKGIYLNRVDDLEARFTILTEFHNAQMNTGLQLTLEEPEATARALAGISDDQLTRMPPGFRQVILELRLLSPAVMKLRKEIHESEVKESLEKIIDDLAKKPGLIELQRLKIQDEDLKRALIRSSSILHTDFPAGGQIVDFVLHRTGIEIALKSAVERFERNRDDLEVQILSSMGIEQFLDNEQMRMFQELEKKVLFQRLPWLVRIWRFLFGKGNIRPEESAAIKRELQRDKEQQKLRIQTTDAKRAQKKLVSERMKSDSGAETESAILPQTESVMEAREEDHEDEPQGLSSASEETIKATEDLKKIVEILDRAWKGGKFPNREFLLSQLGEDWDEDALILFLKKFGRKEILSFRIQHDKPEYVWPILITRRYVSQNGHKMLRDAMARADEQRNASMPNQEKFDVNTSIEDFLNRVLSKKG